MFLSGAISPLIARSGAMIFDPMLPFGVGEPASADPSTIYNRLCVEATWQRAEGVPPIAVKACGAERIGHH